MKFFLLFLIGLLLSTFVSSQVFLQGNYLEVGIHTSASFGSNNAPPASFHPTQTTLGFVFDYTGDGWDSGDPIYMGDYFVPGSPEEGWGVEWNDGPTSYNFNNFGLNGVFDIPMYSMTDDSHDDTLECNWMGEAVMGGQRLTITHRYWFTVNDRFFVDEVTFRNTGTETIYSLEFLRNVDADNEVDWTGDYTTKNYVISQPGGELWNRDTAAVCSRGLIYDAPLILSTVDSGAVVSVEGFSNRDPDDILDTPVEYDISEPSIYDEAIALAIRLGDLEPGEEKSITYAYSFDDTPLDVIWDIILDNPTRVDNDNIKQYMSVYPNPVNNQINVKLNLNEDSLVEISVYDLFGRRVEILCTKELNKGSHKLQFDTSSLSSGLYLMKLNINGQKLVNKMMKD